jgi:hypothetical protein
MTSNPAQPAKQKVSPEPCKYPQVQIVSRDEDSKYVECKECDEIFESSEFKDMEIGGAEAAGRGIAEE